jgi:hypothetical protein
VRPDPKIRTRGVALGEVKSHSDKTPEPLIHFLIWSYLVAPRHFNLSFVLDNGDTAYVAVTNVISFPVHAGWHRIVLILHYTFRLPSNSFLAMVQGDGNYVEIGLIFSRT